MEIERLNTNGLPKEKKIFGKYYRNEGDALKEPKISNDPTLSYHREISFLWSKSGSRRRFDDEASTQKALYSGEYFSSPALASEALKDEKEGKLKAKAKKIEDKIVENDKIIEKSIEAKKLEVEA